MRKGLVQIGEANFDQNWGQQSKAAGSSYDIEWNGAHRCHTAHSACRQVWPLFRALVLDAIFHSVPAPNSVQLSSADCKYRIRCILLSDYRRIMSCATKVC